MTNEQINAWIAEKVMGWEKNEMYLLYYTSIECTKYSWSECAVGELYDPYNNIAQAIEALEAWRMQDKCERTYIIDSMRNDQPKVGLCIKYREFDPYDYDYTGYSPNLAHAICDALVQATGGE